MVIENRRRLMVCNGMSARMTLAVAAALAGADMGVVSVVGRPARRRPITPEDYERSYRAALEPPKREPTPIQQEIIDAAEAKRRRKALKMGATNGR